MNRMLRIPTGKLVLAIGASLAVGAGPAAAERLTRIDGATSEITVAMIDGDRVVLTNETAVALDDVWRIDRAPASVIATGALQRVVLDRGEIPARRVTVENGICRFDWAGGPDAGITQSVVRALILEAGAVEAAREAAARALEKTTAADQVVALGKDDVVLTIDGCVKTVGTNAIVMQYEGKDRTLGRGKVCAVVFGRTGTTDRASASLPWRATVAGGAWMEGTDARLAAGVLSMTIGEAVLNIPWSMISGVEHRGGNTRFLSRMDPVHVTGGAVVALALSWQRDRNAMGRPLRLRGAIRETGLGMHAPAELVFEVPEGMQRFLAVVGLDEEFGRGGDCVVVVQVDDREALRRRIRGTDEALPVDIRTGGGRRLTLRVEPGESYDLGDHVNWYDARLVR